MPGEWPTQYYFPKWDGTGAIVRAYCEEPVQWGGSLGKRLTQRSEMNESQSSQRLLWGRVSLMAEIEEGFLTPQTSFGMMGLACGLMEEESSGYTKA